MLPHSRSFRTKFLLYNHSFFLLILDSEIELSENSFTLAPCGPCDCFFKIQILILIEMISEVHSLWISKFIATRFYEFLKKCKNSGHTDVSSHGIHSWLKSIRSGLKISKQPLGGLIFGLCIVANVCCFSEMATQQGTFSGLRNF